MPQGELAQVLREILPEHDDRLVVGPQSLDDAGVLRLGKADGLPPGVEIGLVQTVDFFPPVVDDPWLYGAIAAANSLSDVYAMGGRAISALALAGFPAGFDPDWRNAIMKGGAAKIAEAGATLAGGHTVQSEMQFGYSVTGLVDLKHVASNDRARVGDVVYLTKSIGMGTMTTAAKKGHISWDDLRPAAEQMAVLNDRAAEAMMAAGANACTDVTGFGLVGHGRNVAKASGLTLEIELTRVPLFGDVAEYAKRGWLSGASGRGRKALAEEAAFNESLPEHLVSLAFDAETSGGLLIFLDPQDAPRLESELAARGVEFVHVGRCVEATGVHVQLV